MNSEKNEYVAESTEKENIALYAAGAEKHISIEAEDWQTQVERYQTVKQSGRSEKTGCALPVAEAAMLDFSA
ncbi:hypothetical protein [Mucilaginibacter celer]|uniref:Uncharacterized protein n=1 Tax=Mucilaginibacter celer TaxID=2305508 RepID=A0A494VHR2_9SPHI|nr:hypothetical protein [Mucilaginibacter celer]AYL94296.1 hypothetical protein HYN43_002855 [Mucilaginibacter celer]